MDDNINKLIKWTRDIVCEHNIIFITAHQHPREPGGVPYIQPVSDVVIIDYISILK